MNGEFWISERILRGSNRECPRHALSFRAEEFQAAIIPQKIFGLEVILHIGTLRYEEHKTYEEIRAILSFHTTLLHHGMIIVGLPYTFEGQERNDEITGGSPYGSSTIAGNTGERMPSENVLAAARFQGEYVAVIASKLARYRKEIIDAMCE